MQVTGRIFIADIGNTQELLCRDLTKRKFDTDHLHALLALAIYTAGQAQAAEFFFMYFSFPELTDLSLQVKDIFFYQWVFYFCAEALHIFLISCFCSYYYK